MKKRDDKENQRIVGSDRIPRLHILTLSFSNPEDEATYLVQHFRALFPLHILIMSIATFGIWMCGVAHCQPPPPPALKFSMIPGATMRVAMHYLVEPGLGFRIHHRIHELLRHHQARLWPTRQGEIAGGRPGKRPRRSGPARRCYQMRTAAQPSRPPG